MLNLQLIPASESSPGTPFIQFLSSGGKPTTEAPYFNGDKGSHVFVQSDRGVPSLLVGLGSQDDPRRFQNCREAAGTALRLLKKLPLKATPHFLPEKPADIEAITDGLINGDYTFDTFRTGKSLNQLESAILLYPGTPSNRESRRFERCCLIARTANETRELGNLPGNILHPGNLPQRVSEWLDVKGITLKIHNEAALVRLKMGGILGVGQGGRFPPSLIEITYTPPGRSDLPHLCLVGKTVTFDSGGISLKSAGGMEEERFDKMGGITVAGVCKALAGLELPLRVTALLPVVENMPSSKAYRPGDILRLFSGETVEIINTDAEGRLILADCLAYAAKTIQPELMLDVATLTGACMVALGLNRAGLFTDDVSLARDLIAAGERVGEPLWHLPVGSDYLQAMRGNAADFRNSAASRWGGASHAASFLRHFAGETRWAHLDIAGTSFRAKPQPWSEAGATAFGLRCLVEFIEIWLSAR